MKIVVESKRGDDVRKTEFNTLSLLTGLGLGLGYGIVARKAYIIACRGGIVSTVLGGVFGVVVGSCVGHTVYELMNDCFPVEKDEDSEVKNNVSD